MPKIFVHAGFHKTATTSFQEFCIRHRAALRRQGLHYARVDFQGVQDRPNHSYAFRMAYNAAAAGDHRLRESLVRELRRQLESCDRMLISGEVISILPEPSKALLLRDLRGLAGELCFVLLVRHPRAYFQSVLQEHLKAWTSANIFDLPDEALATLADHEWGSLYTKRLAFFRAHLKDEELLVRKYEDASRAPGGAVGFLVEGCLGLHFPATEYGSSRRANAAFPHEKLLLICALKSLRTRTGADDAAVKRLFGVVSQAAPRSACGQAFAATLAHRLPPIGPQLAWLEANFGIHYALDDVAFEQVDPAALWSPDYIEALLDFARRQLDAASRELLAAALDFLARRPESGPAHAPALVAASRRLRAAG